MEQKHRRRTSGETRFELNAVMSVFNHSRAVFLNTYQKQQVLNGRIPVGVFFAYNDDVSNAFKSDTGSEVPPVHELFAGFIGPYRYFTSLNTETDCDAQMSVTEARSPSPEAHEILTPEEQSTIGQEASANSWNDPTKSEVLPEIIDRIIEMEAFLTHYDEL